MGSVFRIRIGDWNLNWDWRLGFRIGIGGWDFGLGLKLVYRLRITFELLVYLYGCEDAELVRK